MKVVKLSDIEAHIKLISSFCESNTKQYLDGGRPDLATRYSAVAPMMQILQKRIEDEKSKGDKNE
jgi:hypothetical protein